MWWLSRHNDRFYQKEIQQFLLFSANPELIAVFNKGQLINGNENIISGLQKLSSIAKSNR